MKIYDLIIFYLFIYLLISYFFIKIYGCYNDDICSFELWMCWAIMMSTYKQGLMELVEWVFHYLCIGI